LLGHALSMNSRTTWSITSSSFVAVCRFSRGINSLNVRLPICSVFMSTILCMRYKEIGVLWCLTLVNPLHLHCLVKVNFIYTLTPCFSLLTFVSLYFLCLYYCRKEGIQAKLEHEGEYLDQVKDFKFLAPTSLLMETAL